MLEHLVNADHQSGGRARRSGLQPWWIIDGGQHERVVLAPPFSGEFRRFERMLEELDVYRLALGQPDPESFVQRLLGKLTKSDLRSLAIDLSGARLRSARSR